MRPLALLVLAEFLALVLLAVLWFGRTAAATGSGAEPPGPPPLVAAEAAPPGSAPVSPLPASRRRQEAVPAVPDVAAEDPVGILVSGHVRSRDRTPVEGASVTFQRDSEYRTGDSAAAGAYAAAGLQPGTWKLSCRAEGFARHEASHTLDRRAFQQIDIELRPAYVVRVRLQDADGKSIVEELSEGSPFGYQIPYVVVTETPLTADLPPTEHTRLLRFGLGEWRGASEGRGDNRLREQGYCGELRLDTPPPAWANLLLRTTFLRSQRIEPDQKELVFTLAAGDVLAKLGMVKMRLIDGVNGEPIRGVGVRLSTAQGGGSVGKSGDDGRVTIERALPGLGYLDLAVKDREAHFRHVRVVPGSVTDLGDITLSAVLKVNGVVVDASGKPASGAMVQWTELDGRTFPQPLVSRRNAAADAEGKFQLLGGRHRYVVSARGRDGAVGFATVECSDGTSSPATITLAAPTRVTLRANFDARAGYVVTALLGDRSPAAVVTLGSEYRTPSMALPPGSYTIEIHDMLSDRLVRSFTLQVGSEPLGIEVP